MKTAGAASSGRKGYLDWLRGVGVLVMVQGHVINSWTAAADRSRDAYHWISFISGIGGAALFLFLAGVGMVLGASARMKRGCAEADSAAAARRRGWQIVGLAFLFRLQSWLISGGPPRTLLKVDVLNVMGVSMIAGALLWSAGRARWQRTAVFVSATVAVTMLTPLVRASDLLAALPDPVEWYLRPAGSATTFTLFPWAGFLLAGCAAGLWLDTSAQGTERRATLGLAVAGAVVTVAGYGASLLPPIYAQADFWTSSPTFFCIRLGILMMLVGVAYLWHAGRIVARDVPSRTAWSPLQELGRSSLFVYWIHVEMTYGVVSAPLHRRLPLEWAWVAFVLFSVALYWLVRLKDRIQTRRPAGGTRLAMAPIGASRS